MTLPPRTHLGPYEILSPLGVGGMGEVYRARDARLGRDVAIKVIARSLVGDAGRLKRFELEARATGALNHPNIISIFDIGSHNGSPFVVMELIEGRTLREIMKEGALTLPRAIEYASQATDGLAAAHAKGIIHRDLKPGNLMVTRDGRMKVLDFGLAKLVARETPSGMDAAAALDGSSVTEDGTVVGTVSYMSPEQIRGEAVDPRTDLFSLGIVLYEMVTGLLPFGGETAADIASAILRDPPVPARTIRTDLPVDLDRLIVRCLEKNPDLRFGSAREMGDQLRRVSQRLNSTAEMEWPSDLDLSSMSETLPVPLLRTSDVPSIAVLPFANRSNDEEDEYFSDGLTDELLNVLAKIKGLRVVGRTSSYQFKGKTVDLRVIGRKLNVATLLEGSVRKTGNRVRITVQLVKVTDGFQLWSNSYDRTLEDIFAVQDDIAQSVVKELRTTLLGEEPDSAAGAEAKADVAAAVRGRGEGGEAYRLFLQGRYFVNRTTREDLLKGMGYLVEALQADPNFALAWAELSGAYAIEAGYGWFPVDAGSERARKAAERALALEPGLAEGLVRLGSVQMNYDRDWKAAEASFRQALEAAPGNAFVLRLAGNLASNLGRLEESIELYRRAVEQDPLSPAGYHSLGITYQAAGHLKESEEAFRMSIELAPQRVGARYGLALTLLAQGRLEAALTEASREPEEVFRLCSSAIILYALGRIAKADESLQELVAKYAQGGAYQIAEVHAARGSANAAFEWLERAYEQRDGGLAEIKPEPLFRRLHEDARWPAFMRRIGLGDDAAL